MGNAPVFSRLLGKGVTSTSPEISESIVYIRKKSKYTLYSIAVLSDPPLWPLPP